MKESCLIRRKNYHFKLNHVKMEALKESHLIETRIGHQISSIVPRII